MNPSGMRGRGTETDRQTQRTPWDAPPAKECWGQLATLDTLERRGKGSLRASGGSVTLLSPDAGLETAGYRAQKSIALNC
jgi:hypothetical protein